MAKREQIAVENINCPGKSTNVDAGKYSAMKRVLLNVLPDSHPGLSQAEMFAAVKPHLPQELWPDGEKSGWWVKTVQLDLEAKGKIVRSNTKPLTWHRI